MTCWPMSADWCDRSGFRIPEGELSCVVGLGSGLWDRLFGSPRPAGLHPMREFAGDKHTAVATPGDLLFHIRAHRLDLCFELAQRLIDRLNGYARVVDEVHGFRSFDERDLLGFVDGTENPAGPAAFDAVVIGDEDSGLRRRQLRHRSEVRARPRGLGRAAGRGAGARDRSHQS